jgi:hypothetical protein
MARLALRLDFGELNGLFDQPVIETKHEARVAAGPS